MYEVKKFGLGNIEPKQFLRPPTEGLYLPLRDHALKLEGEINALAARTAERFGLSTKRDPVFPQLRIGSEFEITYFSNQANPDIAGKRHIRFNPNYLERHADKMSAFSTAMALPEDQGGIGSSLMGRGCYVGSLTAEIRTPPSSVQKYFEQVSQIKNGFRIMLQPTALIQPSSVNIFICLL